MPILKDFRGTRAVFSDGTWLDFPSECRIEFRPADPRFTYAEAKWQVDIIRPDGWRYGLAIAVNSTRKFVEDSLGHITRAILKRAEFLAGEKKAKA